METASGTPRISGIAAQYFGATTDDRARISLQKLKLANAATVEEPDEPGVMFGAAVKHEFLERRFAGLGGGGMHAQQRIGLDRVCVGDVRADGVEPGEIAREG